MAAKVKLKQHYLLILSFLKRNEWSKSQASISKPPFNRTKNDFTIYLALMFSLMITTVRLQLTSRNLHRFGTIYLKNIEGSTTFQQGSAIFSSVKKSIEFSQKTLAQGFQRSHDENILENFIRVTLCFLKLVFSTITH